MQCEPGEAYNIGGSTTTTVGEFLELLKTYSRVPIKSLLDPKLLRPTDVTLQIPDTTKFTKRTGWRPKYSLDQSIEHLLEHLRKQ